MYQIRSLNLKSFKVIDLKIIQDKNFLVPEVLDGVIINLEHGEQPWIIEIVTKSDLENLLENLKGSELDMMVTITRPTNAPAKFSTQLMAVNKNEDKLSVIFKGSIVDHGPNYAENLLDYLVRQGLQGDELVNEFNARMESKDPFDED